MEHGVAMAAQESYVRDHFHDARACLPVDQISDRQIQGKLRNEYHGVVNDDYVPISVWRRPAMGQ